MIGSTHSDRSFIHHPPILQSAQMTQHAEIVNEKHSLGMEKMSNKKILVVDDNPDVRKGMQVRLTANHYDTFFASDAIAAIAQARTHQPDLIILDLGLPAGDGFVVMQWLKAIPALDLIPIIVFSARDARANRSRALEAGAKVFLQKPVGDSEFLAAIRHALGEPALPKKSVVYELGMA
jgi:DNA-binding response OmpR family regulator